MKNKLVKLFSLLMVCALVISTTQVKPAAASYDAYVVFEVVDQNGNAISGATVTYKLVDRVLEIWHVERGNGTLTTGEDGKCQTPKFGVLLENGSVDYINFEVSAKDMKSYSGNNSRFGLFQDGVQNVKVTLECDTHSFTNYTSTATCTEDGTKSATCDRCTATDTQDDAAKGHSFGEYVSNNDATCTEDGTETAKCNNCDATDSRTVEGTKKDHSFTDYTSNNDATCTKDGTETAKCDNCDATDSRTVEGTKKDHSFTDYTSNNDATCTEDGTETAKCDNCDATDIRTEQDSKTGHKFTEYVYNNDATTEKDGTKTAVCDNCHEVESTIPAEGTKLPDNNNNNNVVTPSPLEIIYRNPVVEEPAEEVVEEVVEEEVNEESAEEVVEEVIEEPVEEAAEEVEEEEIIEVEEEIETPEGTPEEEAEEVVEEVEEEVAEEETEEVEEEAAEEEIIEDLGDVETPQGDDTLPQTGVLSMTLFYGLGALCVAFGGATAVRSAKKDEE